MTHAGQTDSWNGVARSLHWLMAVLILVQAPLGWIGSDMERSPLKVDVLTAHKSLGITLLLLAALRLLWRLTHATPPHPPGSEPWKIRAAGLSHAALYGLMIALPLSGWLVASTSIVPWKLWWTIPWPALVKPDMQLHEITGAIHEALVWGLVTVLAVHVAAALWHHFAQHDDVLRRMLRGSP